MAEPDLYDVLGVPRTATTDQIRKAYRRLARKHHPDVNPGKPEEAETFKRVSAANEVLSDEKRRKAYDEFGDASLRSGFDADRVREYQRAGAERHGHGGDGGEGREGRGFDFDLGDLFGGRRARSGPTQGDDILARVELDLAQAISGVELSVDAPTGQPCSTCAGAGTLGAKCGQCAGSGRVNAVQGPMRIVAACPACGGNGKQPCAACRGSGVVHGTRKVTVRIPPGAADGSRLRVAGTGGPGRMGGPAGDLVIEVAVRPHRFFRRDGLDLHLTLPVTVAEAYLGASLPLPTPQGAVQLKVPPRSQNRHKLRLRGKGVRRGDTVGDLYVELDLRLPEKEDERFVAAVEAARDAYDKPVREEVTL